MTKRILLALATSGVMGALCPAAEQGQPSFDVASFKFSPQAGRGSEEAANGTLTIRNRSLRNIIEYAYDIGYWQIRGPDWISRKSYDVFGKASGPVSASELKLMLRTLLAERVRLKVHREEAPASMTVMTVGKNGPKGLTPVDEGKPAIEFDQRVRVFRRFRMEDFTRVFGGGGSPTLDQTGLQGRFDFRLDIDKFVDPAAEPLSTPEFLAATRDAAEAQLGMKFEVKKVSLEMLVIDSVEKTPKEN